MSTSIVAYIIVVGATHIMTSLVPRPPPPPPRLACSIQNEALAPFLHTASDQKLYPGNDWERG